MNAQSLEQWFDPETTTFGDRIAGARELAGMSQQDLAKRLGVKLETLEAWEDDLSEPRANKLSMMAGLLNVSLPWLLSGDGEGPLATTGSDMPKEGVSDLMVEIREVRAQLSASADRLKRLETALLAKLGDEALAE